MQNNEYEQHNQYNRGYDNGYESGYMAAMQMQQQQMVTQATNKSNKVPIVIKSILISLIANFAAMYAIALIGITIEDLGDNTADVLEYCERNYIEMDYHSLKNELELYATYDEKYEKYWEFVDGYELYAECQQWVECEKSGMNGAADNLTMKLSQLQSMASESTYPSNKEAFEDFILEINGLR